MKRHFVFLLLFLPLFFLQAQQKKALIIGTNVGTFNNSVNGTYLVEIVPPLQYFKEQGFEVNVVTPLGGKVALYQGPVHRKVDSISKTGFFIEKTANSLKPSQVDPLTYDIVYIPGGYGQFGDVCKNKEIQQLISQAYEHGAALGTAGHGAASLTYVPLKDGTYLVKGKQMTCFPTWVEKKHMDVSSFGAAVPFDMQAELAKNGALLTVSTAEDQKVRSVIVDIKNKLVTGAFAEDATAVAVELVKMAQTPSK